MLLRSDTKGSQRCALLLGQVCPCSPVHRQSVQAASEVLCPIIYLIQVRRGEGTSGLLSSCTEKENIGMEK